MAKESQAPSSTPDAPLISMRNDLLTAELKDVRRHRDDAIAERELLVAPDVIAARNSKRGRLPPCEDANRTFRRSPRRTCLRSSNWPAAICPPGTKSDGP